MHETISPALDVQDAINLIASNHFDAVVLDVSLVAQAVEKPCALSDLVETLQTAMGADWKDQESVALSVPSSFMAADGRTVNARLSSSM